MDHISEALLDPPITARLLGVKPRTLEGWRRRGRGPAFVRLGGKTVRYRRKDLDRWLAERTVNDDSPGSLRVQHS